MSPSKVAEHGVGVADVDAEQHGQPTTSAAGRRSRAMSRIGDGVGQRADRRGSPRRSPATRAATSRVSPPVASSSARPPTARDHLAQQRRAACCRSSRKSAPAVDRLHAPRPTVVTSTCTGTSGNARPDRRKAARDAAGREHVVVLDHGDVVQAHPLVGAAAGPHRVLLQRAQARAWSCGCPAPCAWCRPARRPRRRVWVATPDIRQSRFSAVRSAVSSARVGPVDGGQHVAAAHPVAVGGDRRHLDVGRPALDGQSNTAGATASPATTPSARATRSAVSVWLGRDGRRRW